MNSALDLWSFMIIDDLLDLWVLHWYIYPLVMTNVAIEHRPFWRTVNHLFLWAIEKFHGDVSHSQMVYIYIHTIYVHIYIYTYIYIHYIYTLYIYNIYIWWIIPLIVGHSSLSGGCRSVRSSGPKHGESPTGSCQATPWSSVPTSIAILAYGVVGSPEPNVGRTLDRAEGSDWLMKIWLQELLGL